MEKLRSILEDFWYDDNEDIEYTLLAINKWHVEKVKSVIPKKELGEIVYPYMASAMVGDMSQDWSDKKQKILVKSVDDLAKAIRAELLNKLEGNENT